jgi:hypothetical protein
MVLFRSLENNSSRFFSLLVAGYQFRFCFDNPNRFADPICTMALKTDSQLGTEVVSEESQNIDSF